MPDQAYLSMPPPSDRVFSRRVILGLVVAGAGATRLREGPSTT
jgi:hypothetical protein